LLESRSGKFQERGVHAASASDFQIPDENQFNWFADVEAG
jgi:hypothetical protein